MMMLVGCWSMHAQTYSNPILPGGYPDPSMVFDGQNYYIVNSSFELFPGLPIHRSDDLVNWEPVGHGLERVEQLDAGVNLMDVQENGGIHAPSIRYHDGVYYLITTNIYSPKNPMVVSSLELKTPTKTDSCRELKSTSKKHLNGAESYPMKVLLLEDPMVHIDNRKENTFTKNTQIN